MHAHVYLVSALCFSFSFLCGDFFILILLKTWVPLLITKNRPSDHRFKLQNFANNSKTFEFSSNLAGSEIVRQDDLDLCQNFQEDQLSFLIFTECKPL